ncbi:MAG: type II toxin-antitoxin system ParD family antitoxin [Thermomicrobiales bacterium]
MNVSLTPRLESMVRHKVETGRYNNASEVVREALRLMEERDRRLQWLRAEIAIGDEQVARGELIDFTPERLEQIKRDARENAGSGKPIKDAVKP